MLPIKMNLSVLNISDHCVQSQYFTMPSANICAENPVITLRPLKRKDLNPFFQNVFVYLEASQCINKLAQEKGAVFQQLAQLSTSYIVFSLPPNNYTQMFH